ncbi:MAG: hypothetical protein U1F44_07345, partial [Coriobacteriia bacterium]|nr:hypothetical protein [Coriobacteriia bacterium]
EASGPLTTPIAAAASAAAPPKAPAKARAAETATSGAPTEKVPAPAPAASGPLDAAAVKRAWPAIQAEFKKLKSSRSHLFDGTEVEVEGDVLVIEFPAGQDFSLQIARTPETMPLLKRSIVTVLRVDPPLELRLGRSGSSGPRPHAPTPSPDDTASPLTDETDSRPVPIEADTDITKLVMDELGAEVIVEHEPES